MENDEESFHNENTDNIEEQVSYGKCLENLIIEYRELNKHLEHLKDRATGTGTSTSTGTRNSTKFDDNTQNINVIIDLKNDFKADSNLNFQKYRNSKNFARDRYQPISETIQDDSYLQRKKISPIVINFQVDNGEFIKKSSNSLNLNIYIRKNIKNQDKIKEIPASTNKNGIYFEIPSVLVEKITKSKKMFIGEITGSVNVKFYKTNKTQFINFANITQKISSKTKSPYHVINDKPLNNQFVIGYEYGPIASYQLNEDGERINIYDRFMSYGTNKPLIHDFNLTLGVEYDKTNVYWIMKKK